MAVFYKWIKGCQPSAKLENTKDKTDAGLWTYLEWGNSNNSNTPGDADSISSTRTYMMPHLKVRLGKDDDLSGEDVQDLGYILTNKMPRPLLNMDMVMNHALYLTDISFSGEAGKDDAAATLPELHSWIQQTGTDFIINSSGTFKLKAGTSITIADVAIYTASNISFSKAAEFSETLKVTGTTELTGKTTIKNKLELDTNEDSDSIKTKGGISATKECSALYFNATSDKRAKENIQPANYNAIDLINKLPVYIYNYKNNTETVTGILAQDLLEAQPKELDLVSNTNASGENNDYMSIKNDKLMFVLLKAIQEQQEQIEELKNKIDLLTKNN